MQSQIEEHLFYGEPDLKFESGLAHVCDLEITAALLSLSGAAWDGKSAPTYQPSTEEPEKVTEWHALLDRPTARQIEAELTGTYMATVILPVIKRDGWTAPDGKFYGAGVPAPMPRAICTLRGRYLYRTDGRVTRAIDWNEKDWRFWWLQWFTGGGLLNGARTQADKRKAVLREYHKLGIVSKLPVMGVDND